MSSDHHTSEKFKEKRVRKNPIKMNLTLNEEQKQAKAIILENPITVLMGHAGSGKTATACQVGLDLLMRQEVSRLIITRPTVSKEDIGFLPGDLREKMDPWLAPIYENLHRLRPKAEIKKMIDEGLIEVLPFGFMRGITFVDAFVIIDEAQNVDNGQMQMALSRLGIDSKMVICGDKDQIDLKDKRQSGFDFLQRLELEVEGINIIKLKQNHRHPIVQDIVDVYKRYE